MIESIPLEGYVLLEKKLRKSQLQKYKLSLVALTLCLGLLLLFITYILTVGIGYKVIYPNSILPEGVPLFWVKRAIAYNSLDNAEFNGDDYIKSIPNSQPVDKYKLVCYYNFPFDPNNTSNYLKPENIDAFLCTHINVCFGTVVNSSIYIPETQVRFIDDLIALRNSNNDLKIIFSIGGADDDAGFAEMVRTHRNRKRFIQSIDKLIREYKFDGVDIDWEFPNLNQDGDKRQKIHFMQLLQEIRRNINKQQKHKYLLSVAVAAPTFIIDNSYDVVRMNEYVDYINLMSYDYHFFTRSTPFTGINAPLYGAPNQIGYFATLNINYSAYYWHFNGMEKQKIVIGLPTYGHSFKLTNAKNVVVGAPSTGYGRLGILGFVDYNQICMFVSENKIKPYFDMDAKSPYAVKYTEWVSYDDSISLTFKTEYIKNNGFGGAMVFSLNADDHVGICKRDIPKRGPKQFPLTNTVKTVLIMDQM